ncbi:ferritin-like domain-containing protein [Sorangium sp. So ce1335]|uniref:ferritin-like domain-containing protein n=1 Tax=Sorangium sp. So ce1335 TaxID=3133335 RepID=UPI003F604AFC
MSRELRARIMQIVGTGMFTGLSLALGCHDVAGGGAGGVTGTGGAGGADSAGGAGGEGGAGGAAGTGGAAGIGGAAGTGGAGGQGTSAETRCFSPEEVRASAGTAGGGEAGGAGGAGGSAATCPGEYHPNPVSCVLYENGRLEDGQCCYDVNNPGVGACGRPFLVGGAPRLAGVEARADWALDAAADAPLALDPATRAALAEAWLTDARLEHASIASFARFTLDLLALGAPPALIEAAQRALADELQHARACFALASRYAGRPLGPGPLAMDGALEAPTLAGAAASAVREGCVGETLAALQAGAQRGRARDPEVCRALDRIAADEAAHAELAWAFVRWALARGGEPVRAAVARAFDEALAGARAARGPERAGVDAAAWRDNGRLTEAERARCHLDAVREVIAPCAEALLSAPLSAAEASALAPLVSPGAAS